MGYEILSDDLYDKGDKKSKKKKFAYEYVSKETKEKQKKSEDKKNSKIESFGKFEEKKNKLPSLNKKNKKINKVKSFFTNKKMFIINIIFIILLIIVGFTFISDFNFFDSDEKIELKGISDEFLNEYKGDIVLESKEFDLSIDESNYNIIDNSLEIKNFNGKIEKQGGSFYFTGKADSVKYSENNLDSKNKTIRIKPEKIFSGEFTFNELNINLKEGYIEIDNKLEFEYDNSSITIKNFKTEFNYNKEFNFAGTADELNLISSKPNIEFVYTKKDN